MQKQKQKTIYSTTIAIDAEHSALRFSQMVDNDKSTIVNDIKSYAGNQYDEKFFNRFKDALRKFSINTPDDSVRKITVILPDNVIVTDTIRVPTMRRFAQMESTLGATLGGLYKNFSDLSVTFCPIQQNKQHTTFAITAAQKNIISSIYAACSENHYIVDTMTFTSSAAVAGAAMINPKLKNETYVLLDIKDIYSRFVFVINGKPVGSYELPFGLEFLTKPKVTQEDMLFDHSYAELMVLNAKEKAKSKKLTVMAMAGETTETVTEDNTDDEDFEDEDFEVEEQPVVVEAPAPNQPNQKLFVKKSPRKLPKFMQREIPETKEGIAQENFRVFVKWALSFIQGNERLVAISRPEFVCVNIPKELEYLLDKVNEEEKENGITFTRLPNDDETGVIENIELYGGLFPKLIGPTGRL